jgi:hypothetical protein
VIRETFRRHRHSVRARQRKQYLIEEQGCNPGIAGDFPMSISDVVHFLMKVDKESI